MLTFGCCYLRGMWPLGYPRTYLQWDARRQMAPLAQTLYLIYLIPAGLSGASHSSSRRTAPTDLAAVSCFLLPPVFYPSALQLYKLWFSFPSERTPPETQASCVFVYGVSFKPLTDLRIKWITPRGGGAVITITVCWITSLCSSPDRTPNGC